MTTNDGPQQRLQQTRQELQQLLTTAGVGHPDAFPRSATMRLLCSGTGSGVTGAVLSALLFRTVPGAQSLLRLIPLKTMVRQLFRARPKRSRHA